MSNRPRKIPQISNEIVSLGNNDLIVVEKNGAGNSFTTSIMKATNLRKSIVRGPYANDSVASTGGISVGEMYYIADGSVKVRLI